jgi:hypothetical protein
LKDGATRWLSRSAGAGVIAGALAVSVLYAVEARAQTIVTSLGWDPSFTASSTEGFIGKATPRAFGIGVEGFLDPQFSVGASVDWRLFNEVASGMIELEDGHASGTQNRTIYAVPVLISSHYYFRSFKDYPAYVPYVGVGVGSYWIEKKLGIGVATFREKAWNFGACFEIGTLFDLRYGYALLRFRYSYAAESDELETLSFYSIGVGIAGMR